MFPRDEGRIGGSPSRIQELRRPGERIHDESMIPLSMGSARELYDNQISPNSSGPRT